MISYQQSKKVLKKAIIKIKNSLMSVKDFGSVKVILNVDNF